MKGITVETESPKGEALVMEKVTQEVFAGFDNRCHNKHAMLEPCGRNCICTLTSETS
jgi:hypothetical protein